MGTLYELTGEYLALSDMLMDDEVDEQTVLDTLEGVKGEIEIKAEGYVKVLRSIESQAEAYEREKAIKDLSTQYFQTYLFGMAPDAIVREADRIAKVKVKEFYTAQERMISKHIRKSGITVKELVAGLRQLDIPDDEMEEWITHCTPQRERIIKKTIKRLKKVKEEEDEKI